MVHHGTSAAQAAQLLVSGVVQMVGYRAWTTRTARELGVTGFVRNLHDGRVEIFAEGHTDAIAALEAACRQGPAGARVDDVARVPRAPRGQTAFVQVATAGAPDAS